MLIAFRGDLLIDLILAQKRLSEEGEDGIMPSQYMITEIIDN
jgi:hypothetical protein